MTTKDIALNMLSSCLPTITKCYEDALGLLNKMMDLGGPLNSKTKPMLFHNLLNNELQKYYDEGQNDGEIRLYNEYDSVVLIIGNDEGVTLRNRFKKLGTNGFPCNAPTDRNDNIESQGCLFSEMDLTYLDIVYVPNETWTEFKHLKIMCIQYKSIIWEVSLEMAIINNISAIEDQQIILETTPQAIIKLKNQDEKDKKTG